MNELAVALKAAAGNAGGGTPPSANAWDLDYFERTTSANAYFDVSGANEIASFSVSSQDSAPKDLFFSPDGTHLYVAGNSGNDVNQYALSTAWDLTTASYVRVFSVNSQETTPLGLAFKTDGTKMYVTGSAGDDVNEYDLSTAWNLSTASYSQNFSVSSQESSPHAVFFKTDGTKMYVMGNSGDDVNEYDLSTAWDVSTASYNQNLSLAGRSSNPRGLFFKNDGTKMFVGDANSNAVLEYDLSTAWDVSTGSYQQSYAHGKGTTEGVHFSPDGDNMYVLSSGGDAVYQFALGQVFLNTVAKSSGPKDIQFKPDGTKFYIADNNNDDIDQYNLSTAWDIMTATYASSFALSGQSETQPQALVFKSDGTKMYAAGSGQDTIYQYDLSTAWDLSTASYANKSFSVSSQDISPSGLYFKSDGATLWMVGMGSDAVNEYSLSTAWDISTASYEQNFSISAQEAGPNGLFFKTDGTMMFISGFTGDKINAYTLSTAWDISTASYSKNLGINPPSTTSGGLYFKSDGTMFFVGDNGGTEGVYSWEVS